MRRKSAAAEIRTLRKKSGLTQREIAFVLGFRSEVPVVRHERSLAIPHLLTALAYEVIFREPISAQFRGFYEAVEMAVEQRLCELEERLQRSDAKGRGATLTARKLVFLTARKES